MERPLRIAVTTGDADGIGTEVACKALRYLGPTRGVVFYLFRSSACPREHLRLLDKKFERVIARDWPQALKLGVTSGRKLVDIESSLPPAKWVEVVGQAAMFGHIDAIATGPLSKTSIYESGLQGLGHTDILKALSNSAAVNMAFVGQHFNVLLATAHIPIHKVSKTLTIDSLRLSFENALRFRALLPKRIGSKPIAVLGLNPHSGENGLIGKEEADVLRPLLEEMNEKQSLFEGPLVPDAAFHKTNWNKYSCFLAMYHDQGLIPFKSFHGHRSGVHVSVGLPFVRTSVDHGTAKDLFKKDKADYKSMLEALNWAVALARKNEK